MGHLAACGTRPDRLAARAARAGNRRQQRRRSWCGGAIVRVSTVDPRGRRASGSAQVVLDGPGGQHRVLRVEMHEAVFDGRYVQARDAQGMVEIRVTPRLCRQDGSATADPYTARLTIEGSAPLMGCGQPLQ
ncbi:MAG: hypothetical protein IPO74_11510 [Thermomonas sp.]|nr:hypothetical protein [Thermomonas sp.]